ncbi:hypothetical protein HOM50_00810 [bacterium]|jgi:hypothetical protein|nr:hypothetical protein [bacterium]MBT5014931.1 hypothetical protein [bacterium]
MKKFKIFILLSLLSIQLQPDSFSTGFASSMSQTKGQPVDSFSLQDKKGVATCSKVILDPESVGGYLFNVYRLRNGKLKELSKAVSPNNFVLYGHPKKVHKSNTTNISLKGIKNSLQTGDSIILDGWKQPDAIKHGVSYFNTDKNRIQLCFFIRNFPKSCKLYINTHGITKVHTSKDLNITTFSGDLSTCNKQDLHILKEHLLNKKKSKKKPTKKKK